jgi:hypothetical protein
MGKLILLILLVATLANCEGRVDIQLDSKTPPTFKLSGSGGVESIVVYELTPEGKTPSGGAPAWEIEPLGPLLTRKWPPVTYGIIPYGFTQIDPVGKTPPPLLEGHKYGVSVRTRSVRSNSIWFTISHGAAVQITKSGAMP